MSCILKEYSLGCIDEPLEPLDWLARPLFNSCSCMSCACLQHEYGSTLGGGRVAFCIIHSLHIYFVPLHSGSGYCGVLSTPHAIWIFLLEDVLSWISCESEKKRSIYTSRMKYVPELFISQRNFSLYSINMTRAWTNRAVVGACSFLIRPILGILMNKA